MEILGHPTLAMVKRYQHVLPRLTVAAAEGMDRVMGAEPAALGVKVRGSTTFALASAIRSRYKVKGGQHGSILEARCALDR